MTAKTKSYSSRATRRHKNKPRGISDRTFEKIHWPYLPIMLLAIFLVSISLQSGVLAAAIKNPSNRVLAYATNMSIGGLLSSTNAARSGDGVASLQLNSKLNAAAQAKAQDMANRNYWSHNTPEGNPPWVFVTSQNYAYQKLGENLAAGFDNEQATINGWLASPPHKQNLMDPAFTEVGFGFANNPNYTSAGGGPMTIVVAFYGKPVSPAALMPAGTPAASGEKTPPPAPVAAATPPTPEPASAPPAPQTPPAASTTPPGSAQPSRPATTDGPTGGITLAVRTSRAQLAFAKIPLSNFAAGLTSFLMIAALGLWISHHALRLRRAWASAETYGFKHPFVDAGLIIIAGVAYLLSQTAGFIQ